MPDNMVTLENISVHYRAPEERFGSFKEFMIRLLQGRLRFREFRALKDVNLEVGQSEVLGLIGHNGAGKSTLLKVVSRVLAPSRGRVVICGKVAPLLELGAGFHPELTGRENIFLNGTLLGRSHREIREKVEDILDFADIESFIDVPLRAYSSGMTARLGFAVATAWQPEVLLVDEVLAVGDDAFQRKCLERIDRFRSAGVTVIIVSHNMETILKRCTRAAWLDHGCLMTTGAPAEVVKAYRASQVTP